MDLAKPKVCCFFDSIKYPIYHGKILLSIQNYRAFDHNWWLSHDEFAASGLVKKSKKG